MKGATYGRKYITHYIDEINKLFDKWSKKSSQKMNPAIIEEFLAGNYPNTYSLPGKTETKQNIYAFVQNNKKSKSDKPKNRNIVVGF